MKKVIVLLAAALICGTIAADCIVTKKGEEIECKVEKISDEDLAYHTIGSSVMRTMKLSSILYVRYDNGEKEFFSDRSSDETASVATSEKTSFR